MRATHNAGTIGVVPQKRPRRRRYSTASYLAWPRPGAVRKALLSATGSFEDKTQTSQRQDKLSLPESGHRSCACPASVGPNRPANRPLCRRNDITTTGRGRPELSRASSGGVHLPPSHARRLSSPPSPEPIRTHPASFYPKLRLVRIGSLIARTANMGRFRCQGVGWVSGGRWGLC